MIKKLLGIRKLEERINVLDSVLFEAQKHLIVLSTELGLDASKVAEKIRDNAMLTKYLRESLLAKTAQAISEAKGEEEFAKAMKIREEVVSKINKIN